MVAGFEDFHLTVVRPVHEPMFVVDPPGPVPGKFPLERFWSSLRSVATRFGALCVLSCATLTNLGATNQCHSAEKVDGWSLEM